MASAAREASLILRLIDQVTAPAKAITSALNGLSGTMTGIRTMRAVSDTVANAGRNMRRAASDAAGLSVPMVILGREAAEAVYNFEKAGNAAQAYGDITAAQREELEKYAALLNEESPFTLNQIMEAANELFRAGLTFEQAMGALRGALQLGTAGDLDVATATDLSTNILTSMRLPIDTAAEVQQSLNRVNDVLAYSAANSNADVLQMAEAFKYAGGVATAVGMPMDELATLFMVMARNGIKGSEAGVALRSGIVRMLRPTLFAQRQLNALNIDMGEFVTLGEKIDFSNIQDAVSSLTGNDLSGVRGPIEALLNDDILKRSPQKLVARVMSLIAKEVEASGADMEVVGDAVTQAIMTGAEKVDMLGFLKELNDKGASAVDMSYIWDVRQGSRLMSLLSEDLDKLLEDFNNGVEGSAARMAATRLLGIVGVVNEFDAAVNDLYLSIANSGVLESITELIKGTTDWLNKLAELNPMILEWGTYGLIAVAALAPLGLVLSGLAATVAFLTNPLTIVVAALAWLAATNFDGLVAFWDNLSKFFTDSLSPEAVGLLGEMIGWFQKLPQTLTDLGAGFDFAGWGEKVGTAAAGVVNALPDLIAGFEDLKARAAPILEKLNPLFNAMGNALSAIAETSARLTGAVFDGVALAIDNFNKNLDPSTVATLSRWADEVVRFTAAMLDAEAAKTRAEGDNTDWLKNLIGGAGKDIADFIDTSVKEAVAIGTWWASFEQGWYEFRDKVREKVAELGSLIVATFSNIDLYAAGKAIIDSLVNGIIAAIPFLKDTISGVQGILGAISQAGGVSGGGAKIGVDGNPIGDYNGLPVPVTEGARAAGGPLWNGWFLAGEKGPELGYASGKGHMFNAQETKRMLSGGGAGGGGVVNHNTFHIQTSDPEAAARAVARTLDRELQRSRGLSMEDRPVYG